MNPVEKIQLEGNIPNDWSGLRLDQALARLFPEHSRSRLQNWITQGWVHINHHQKKARDKVLGGETVHIHAIQEIQLDSAPQKIDFPVIYEDESLLVIHKPAGLVVHPGAGNRSGTLVNALLYRHPELKHIPRAGIVHRLDKDTTGLMVVAKTLFSHTELVKQLQTRQVKRIYEAIVWGVLISGGTIQTQMGRHPVHRSKMAVVEKGKEAITHYRVLQRFNHHTHLELSLETGRTHQIRVHMAHLNAPLVGDKTYGGRTRIPPKASEATLAMLKSYPRQALHARRLAIFHPQQKKMMEWESDLPEEMKALLEILK